MQPEEEKSIVVEDTTTQLQQSISSFNAPLSGYLQNLGLPTDNILYPIEERRKVIDSLGNALSHLPMSERERASYLTKFAVAITIGLFDSALNYLWNETVNALRKLVTDFDLAYYYSVAEKVNPRYKGLSEPEDLEQVSEHDTLETCRRIGIITDFVYKKLEFINYMRNHASAAHPNDNDINGYEMLGWLENAIRYAITATPDVSAVTIKRLLDNIRTVNIPDDDFVYIGEEVAKLPQERIDDFLWSIFGMFTDPKVTAIPKDNIRKLAKHVWDASSDNRKYDVGSRFGVYRKNGDVPKKDATDEFLVIVQGVSFKDEDSLAGELIEKLEMLKSAHGGMNNFYNEHPHAMMLGESLPPSGAVPRAARTLWVKVICKCFIGNGLGYREGVDEGALPYYKKYIMAFGEAEIIEFIHLMADSEFTFDLDRTKPDARIRTLAKHFLGKPTNVHIQKILTLIKDFPALKLEKAHNTKEFSDLISLIPRFK
ncbi:hypothetical protein J4772_06265 [Cohnella sp. LGH]|uniref:hypothetical protein n=1 Tax=Cohnella sp. LGH TaxID=1619153 RepID=UPI001ADAF29D|nr:hypothetical protein [Cohnella sp. LGH]QTH44007.1 hypothetical protein J4772_06265 [Cohnella sp. LGH]